MTPVEVMIMSTQEDFNQNFGEIIHRICSNSAFHPSAEPKTVF